MPHFNPSFPHALSATGLRTDQPQAEAGIQVVGWDWTPDPFDVAQGRGEHSRTTIKTFGGDAIRKKFLSPCFDASEFSSLPNLIRHHNLKSRLAFLDKIFSLTSGDSV